MAIFDIEKDELLRFSDTQLEELIARLAEAEVAAHGHSPAYVSWSGSINAPDGGIDIHVQVPVEQLSTGFIERPDTIFQAKKHSMPKAAITAEMAADETLSPTISEQAAKGGSYIIVSLGDDCSSLMKRDRLKAMWDTVKDDPNRSNIHLDFYDRSKLAQWLRQHPSIMLWAKRKLGQGYSGWRPYGAWSNPPEGALDSLISAPGVTVTLPSAKEKKLNIEDAIAPMRELIRSTKKAVRITGLSGVGKTRIVQALFDETVGTDALDRTIAVYVDTGESPEPSATAMLERLIAEGRRAIIILDNCPSELHTLLASKVAAKGTMISLITAEYDIRDDKPQTTEVIQIEAVGPEVAEQLLLRRFPNIGRNNARRIAEFADGNARVSLAIAERVEEGESLAQLSYTELFNRLFEQRNHPDDDLRAQAEILSLVYSFSVSTIEENESELEVLGSISGYSENQLFRAISKLSDRHIVQKRAHWRAILPHAIANRLASSALNYIPVNQLRAIFETPGRQRLLMSFAHRLGLLHDHPVAKEIVETWLKPDGLLGRIAELDDILARMLDYIGPVAPETLLDRIEMVLTTSDFKGMKSGYNSRWTTILNLLQLLAYEPNAFERCIRLLIHVADYEEESNDNNSVKNQITQFFQAYLSGTHASLSQRISIMNECLASDVPGRRSLGFRMLLTALAGPHWTGFGMNEFGARPRDYGFYPNHAELVEWRSAFIDVAVRLGTSGDPALEVPARQTLANEFRGMWHQEAMREKLIASARKLHAYHPWGEGWKSIRSIIYFDHTKRKNVNNFESLPDNLAALEKELEPHDLIPAIQTYVLSKGHDYWALDTDFDPADTNKYDEARKRLEAKAFRLGEEFAVSVHKLDELGPNLFSNDWMPNRAAFGRGLAKGAYDLRVCWQQLVDQLELQPGANRDFAVFGGFIEEVDSVDPALAQELLDQCAQHPALRQVLVGLHPRREFTETDLDRCMMLLDGPDIHPSMYESILWRDEYAHLPKDRVLDLAIRLLCKPNGDYVVLDALSMKLHGAEGTLDMLGADLRLIGLRAAILSILRVHSDPGGSMGYRMECVINAALRFEGNETEKREWLDAIFAVVDRHYGHVHSCESAIETTAALMPEEFLNRVFEGTEEQQDRRQFLIRDSGLRSSPLAKINVDVLIEWCRTKGDPNVWGVVASGIRLWTEDEELEEITIQESALRLLEESPDPTVVLEAFAERVWSGSRTNVMQPRADAIGKLVEHARADITAGVQSVSAKLVEWIKREKEREQIDDMEHEQRFE
ncbi:ATP-binding protein [Aeromonas encheleia]|uniref:ATP-binding protein n=1 Tax=Aeromonas encheleia TaxID=73010 RepID=UPI001F5A76FD|nr:ATP-binding protein [Aeromonas encheleia]UNP90316.1 ATP-binding protein [Aeromonas encheleia]